MNNSTQIPSELVIEIISHLTRIKDVKNCMLISKEIRDMIFRTPKIMKKIHFNFSNDLIEAFDFLTRRGSSIRDVAVRDSPLIAAFLHQLPNLEDLLIHEKLSKMCDQKMLDDIQKQYGREDDDPIEMARLKNFMSLCPLDNLIVMKMKNVTTLEKFVYFPMDTSRDAGDTPIDFICQQKNLKELVLMFTKMFTRDISAEVKFQLKYFDLNVTEMNDEHLVKFMETQADSLEEFKYNLNLSFELCEVIFRRFKKLKNLEVKSSHPRDNFVYTGYAIHEQHFSHWKLESVKYFHETSDELLVDLNAVCSKFPNLEHLQCNMIKNTAVNFRNLKIFQLSIFMCENLRNAKFPNLKKLSVGKIIKSEAFGDWKCFVENFPSIEKISIRTIETTPSKYIVAIMKILKDLKNLKLFEFNQNSRFHSVKIDTVEKTVVTSNDIPNNFDADWREIYGSLKENFDGFEFRNRFAS